MTRILFLLLTILHAASATELSTVAYGLRGLANASTGFVPENFKECEAHCPIRKIKNPRKQQNENRNAFNCRRENRQVCERKTCHLGYHCFTETKDQWRKDIGLLFGEKLCRLEKLKDKVLSKDEEKVCREERYEHIEFPNTVTKGFLGDKSFFYPLAGQGDGKDVWNSVLRFLDGGMDEAGPVGRGGKKSEEKIDLFCKKFKGGREAFRKNAQEVGFKLPALTYDKL
jgi:hypothetical protein